MLSFRIWYWPPHNIMWFPVTLLLLVGVAVATFEHNHAWEEGNEYRYLVHSRTTAGLELKEQYTGIQLKGIVVLQVISPNTLRGKIVIPQYAHIHKTLPDGPESEFSDQMLEYRPIPMSGKPFELRLKHGVIRDVLVAPVPDVPTWELNIIKGFVSSLQIDTQGENAIESKSNQIPVNENSSAMFTAMEDSVGGYCEVLYDITPLPDNYAQERPDRIPMPHLHNGRHYDVKKTKNFEKCQQRQLYHYGVYDPLSKEKLNGHNKILSQLSATQSVITGDLKRFTIQSAVTKNQIFIKSGKSDSPIGTVNSVTRLTLVKKSNLPSVESLELDQANLESTGNLMYTYNNPFSENRIERRARVSRNSAQVQSSESSSSSSQNSKGNLYSSSSSSSSSSSEEEQGFYQSRAALHMAPNVPLLPFFVGYKGQNIQMSNNFDVVDNAQNLISQIAEDLHNGIPRNNTLEKYTILRNLIRIMNVDQYNELENGVINNNKDSSPFYNDSWAVLRDAVVQAGTGPGLLTINKWIQNGRLKDVEAARVLSQIPKNVREPTAQYVKAFYEMILESHVSQQRYVNVSAPIALAELILNNRAGQKYYPIYSFGPMVRKDDNDVVNVYIPYMANQLQQGYFENNNQKIQTYIVALSYVGHPKILSVFEPYLEGAKPASKYQRMLMVSFLSVLARLQPKLVGPILYKLYLNVNEDHEIRCLAVQQLILTDPPLIMLQRIAKYTYFDKSQHVTSAVKTTLDSIANMKQLEWRNLANKARSVKHLLNPLGGGRSYSRGYYKDFSTSVVKTLKLQTIGGGNGPVPQYLRLGLNTIYDFLEQPTEAEYAVSDVQQLFDQIKAVFKNDEQESRKSEQKSLVEKLAQTLNIKPGYQNKLEGNFFLNTLYGLLFYPLGNNTVATTYDTITSGLKKNNKVESTVFYNHEITIALPTENGLPFIYTSDSPILVKAQTQKQGASSTKKKNGIVDVMFARNNQVRLSFIVPFEHQNYISGVDYNQMLHVPVQYEVELDVKQRNLALKLQPNLPQPQTDQLTLFYYSTTPFTTRQDIFDLRSVYVNKNTHYVLPSQNYKLTVEEDNFSMKVEVDKETFTESNIELYGETKGILKDNFALLSNLQAFDNNRYKKFEVFMNSEQVIRNEHQFNIVYDNAEVDGVSQKLETNFPRIYWPPNSADRRDEIKKGLSKDLKAGKIYIVDINYNNPISQEQQVLSLSMVNSNVDRKVKTYIYWNSQLPKSEEKQQEVCYLQEIQYSPNTPLNFEHMLKNPPQDILRAELLYGKSCKKGDSIFVIVNATRSNLLNNVLENSKSVKHCLEDVRKGNKLSLVCQKVTEAAQMRDQYELAVEPPNANFFQKIISRIIDTVMDVWHKIRSIIIPGNSTSPNTVTAKVNMLSLGLTPQIHMRTPQLNIIYPYPTETLSQTQQLLTEANALLQNEKQEGSCSYEKNQVITFDNQAYTAQLGNTVHVLLTTYPLQNPNNHKHLLNIPKDYRIAVLAEDTDDGSKNITILLDNREVKLEILNNRLVAMVAGKVVEVSEETSHQDRNEDGQINFEIFNSRVDGSMILISDKYGIGVEYDGKRVQTKVSKKYRNIVRGLCGNYDSNPNTDFLTPQNCVLTKAEQFVATYALIHENSQGPVLENKRKAEQAQCKELVPEHQNLNNVISDREAGRTSTEGKNWGYHQDNRNRQRGHNRGYNSVPDSKNNNQEEEGPEDKSNHFRERRNMVYHTRVVEEGDEICFTTRPVPTCSEGTNPTERKSKKYQLYCTPTNEESIALKKRVHQGANPDLSRKPVSKSHVFQVPSVCGVP